MSMNSTMTMRIAMMRMGIPTVIASMAFSSLPSPGSSIHESTAFRQSFSQSLLIWSDPCQGSSPHRPVVDRVLQLLERKACAFGRTMSRVRALIEFAYHFGTQTAVTKPTNHLFDQRVIVIVEKGDTGATLEENEGGRCGEAALYM
jgi:hypothetical protein